MGFTSKRCVMILHEVTQFSGYSLLTFQLKGPLFARTTISISMGLQGNSLISGVPQFDYHFRLFLRYCSIAVNICVCECVSVLIVMYGHVLVSTLCL